MYVEVTLVGVVEILFWVTDDGVKLDSEVVNLAVVSVLSWEAQKEVVEVASLVPVYADGLIDDIETSGILDGVVFGVAMTMSD